MTRLLIANRGEIARRILRAARARGHVVAVVSTTEDAGALVRREADVVLEVSSFLDIPGIVRAATAWHADVLHPGYGFLSENAEFAEAVTAAGIGFVGPTAANMRALGNKEAAKTLARTCGVPTLEAVAASALEALPREIWAEELAARGLRAPYLVKASAGGGGRGMRVVESVDGLARALELAAGEAEAAFGDGAVFLERYISSPRHVEIQVFGDGQGGGVFLGERECSLQRRHQKVVEEALSVAVDAALREAMGRAALALVRASRYRGAGTAEFLLESDGRFHFLEMNTRLQVEHPVTELVYGVDLVQAQLELAEGGWPEALGDPGVFAVPEPRGVALEARVLAEDPGRDFLPASGPLRVYREPAGPGVRVDSGVREGDRITVHFDSLIAKLIVWGANRAEAVARLSEALDGFQILGCTTNLPFLRALSRHPDFLAGREGTAWIAEHLPLLAQPRVPPPWQARLDSAAFRERLVRATSGMIRAPQGPSARFAALGGGTLTVAAPGLDQDLRLISEPDHRSHFALHTRAEGAPVDLWACRQGTSIFLSVFGEHQVLEVAPPGGVHAAADDLVCAPMAGKVIEIRVSEGEPVGKGQVLFVVESMKMQVEVAAPRDGRIATVAVEAGQILGGPETMAVLEPV